MILVNTNGLLLVLIDQEFTDVVNATANLINDAPVFENTKMNEKFKDFKME
jgi:hypothetical protein